MDLLGFEVDLTHTGEDSVVLRLAEIRAESFDLLADVRLIDLPSVENGKATERVSRDCRERIFD
jgi:hypothetical protein